MTDLITLVMQAAATEVLQREADQIDEEVQRLLAEIERAPTEECRRGGFTRRFLELLKRRGEVARRAPVIFVAAQQTSYAFEPSN
jgi:ribosomal protein L17